MINSVDASGQQQISFAGGQVVLQQQPQQQQITLRKKFIKNFNMYYQLVNSVEFIPFLISANGQQVTVIQPGQNMTNVGGLANLGNLTQVRPNVFQVRVNTIAS